ncbi:hypothetical protein GALMADRAFT_140184 [Galerina marginata CBS 339.88]|uniref:BTB domain-containing protein n=1 Tax=Galerina marginata (strain CBS 339.88) TaxID=685588 RepID=A0A067SXD8_GALM3|nr:hypothetical protein GALMADRAFT_140184 [Galerina marginata CBS 339.88]
MALQQDPDQDDLHITIEATLDPDFYFGGDYIVLQAENIIFRVPSEPLIRGSEVFSTMFTLPQGEPKDDLEGGSPKHPIMLPTTIKAEDFRNLLKMLYPRDAAEDISLTKSQWTSILKTSTEWYFLPLRKAAISELMTTRHALDAFEKILLGRQLKIAIWIIQGYQELVQRDDTISNAEAIILEVNSDPHGLTALSLLRIREQKIRLKFGSKAKNMTQSLVRLEIEKEFQTELKAIRAMEEGYGAVQEEFPVPAVLVD